MNGNIKMKGYKDGWKHQKRKNQGVATQQRYTKLHDTIPIYSFDTFAYESIEQRYRDGVM